MRDMTIPAIEVVSPLLLWNLSRERRSLANGLVVGVLTPLTFLLAFGIGLGDLIEGGGTFATSDEYFRYVGAGLLVGSAMQWAGISGLWSTAVAVKWTGAYQAVLHTPVTTRQLAYAHLAWIAARCFIAGWLFLAVLVLIVQGVSVWALALPSLAALTAVAFAGPICGWSIRQPDDRLFSVVSRVILTPLFLFSGTFFPVDRLPRALEVVVSIFPLRHAVDLGHQLLSGADFSRVLTMQLLYLASLGALGVSLTVRAFRRELEGM